MDSLSKPSTSEKTICSSTIFCTSQGRIVARGASKIAIKVVLNNKDLYGAASAKTRFNSCASNWFEEGFLVNFFLQMSYIFLI